jgi:hypothetical protein
MTTPAGFRGAEDATFFEDIRRYDGQVSTYLGRYEVQDLDAGEVSIGDTVRLDIEGGHNDFYLMQALRTDALQHDPFDDSGPILYWRNVLASIILSAPSIENPNTEGGLHWVVEFNLNLGEGQELTGGQYLISTTVHPEASATITFDMDAEAVKTALSGMLDAASVQGGPWNSPSDTDLYAGGGVPAEQWEFTRTDSNWIEWTFTFDADTLEVDGEAYAGEATFQSSQNGVLPGVVAPLASLLLTEGSMWVNVGDFAWSEISLPNDDTFWTLDSAALATAFTQGSGDIFIHNSSKVFFQVKKRHLVGTGRAVVRMVGKVFFDGGTDGEDNQEIRIVLSNLADLVAQLPVADIVEFVYGTAQVTSIAEVLEVHHVNTMLLQLVSFADGTASWPSLTPDDSLSFDFWFNTTAGD